MIKLSNGHSLEHVLPSGAFGFDGKGWLWEWPLVGLGLIQPELFTVFLRTVTRQPRLYPKCNLSWIRPWTWLPLSPWSCVRLLPDGGVVNKVGLYNPGADWWCEKVGPKLDFKKIAYAGSIYGNRKELVEMAVKRNPFGLVAEEVNDSCPNSGHPMEQAEEIIDDVKVVAEASRHPVIVKVSVDQDYLAIARGLHGVAEAISLNSVPFKTAFPNGKRSPLWRLEKRVGGGGGGVSGGPAQRDNWAAVEALAKQGELPVIAPGIMKYEDMGRVRKLGAGAVSFGAIHIQTKWKPWTIFTNPCKPTAFVRRETACR